MAEELADRSANRVVLHAQGRKPFNSTLDWPLWGHRAPGTYFNDLLAAGRERQIRAPRARTCVARYAARTVVRHSLRACARLKMGELSGTLLPWSEPADIRRAADQP